MLSTLHISNYALIDSIDLTLHHGLNIITGETGGGKSIMLSALSLLLGGRADTRSVRRPEKKSVIEASFAVDGNESLRDYCATADIDWEPAQMILRREIAPSGRTRAFINDTPVTLDVLRAVGLRLVDIHSQHQNQLLSDPAFQLDIIDMLAGNSARLAEYSQLYGEYRAALQKLKSVKAAIASDRENADFMQFQLKRLEDLALQPDEMSTLESERVRLIEQSQGREAFDKALVALSGGEENAGDQIRLAIDALSDIAERLPEDGALVDRLEKLNIELSDIADSIEALASAYSPDAPAELDEVERRIGEISAVISRHNAADAGELIAMQKRMQRKLERLDDADRIIAELEKQARVAKKRAMESAAVISGFRRDAAADFAKILHDTAMPLGMKNLVCDISVESAPLSPAGADAVEFRFAFNKNQIPVPVRESASGGEISRLMLSVKSIIAHRMQLPSIIFDEVDTGVSGDVADRMGRMMKSIASNIQVIAITHLPQVAAKGSHHFKVSKHDTETSTVTKVEILTPEGRVGELALMLSGDASNEAARSAAKALLGY
ncbi:MAG: DNA repair protein RecN [Paramuribaculum sp.]|nr:DNA repair protein RecN [Paramuribaculum sp.]MDE6488918.1 DNA repair protein RecN [Paramuribaculum sp.]